MKNEGSHENEDPSLRKLMQLDTPGEPVPDWVHDMRNIFIKRAFLGVLAAVVLASVATWNV